MKYILTSALYLLMSLPLFAVQTTADSLYVVQDYKRAAAEYQAQLSEGGISDELFYNIGNCYFRMNQYPQAILNYQKALKMNPQHADAQDNLLLCYQKVGVQEFTGDELFYTTWFKQLVGSRNANAWGRFALVFFALFIALGVGYLLARKPLIKKIAFFSALVPLALTILMNVFAHLSNENFSVVTHLVAMKETMLYESATNASKQITSVPAGVVLKLNESFGDEWFNVSLPDGRSAWCEKATVEKVELNR